MLLLHSELSYTTENTYMTVDFRRQKETEDLSVSCSMEKGRIKVCLHPKHPITLQTVKMTFSYPYDRQTKIFVNGYQSWTDSFEYDVNTKFPGLSRVPSFLQKKYLSYHLVIK